MLLKFNQKLYDKTMTTSLKNISKKYSNIEVQLNRLLSQKASLQHKLKLKNKSERKVRTRTLIQLGGILSLTPLDICDIHLGDDLQLSCQYKADLLLGILSFLLDRLPEKQNTFDLEHFKLIGKSLRCSHIKLGQ